MNRRFPITKDFKSTFLDTSDDCDENVSPWNLYCSNDERTFLEQKTEILWSREQKSFVSEHDFFRNDYDSFSDLTGRSTSSCSWHNDDFEVKSSNKVSLSLEAIDDALYDNQRSPFISEELYQECCDWSKKFPYIRLKGKQIIKPLDEISDLSETNLRKDISQELPHSSASLHVEGRKISVFTPDKPCTKAIEESATDTRDAEVFDEEVIVSDGQYDENCVSFNSQKTNIHDTQFDQIVNDAENDAVLKSLEAKIIEKLAQNVWPKVLEVLKKPGIHKKADKTSEDFQLPPISTAVTQRKYMSTQRPRTEGTNMPISDFPKLTGILSVSPKILQERKECRSGKSSFRSSRPNSEIHFSQRSHAFSSYNDRPPHKGTELLKTSTTPRQAQFNKKGLKKDEKDYDKASSYLPALEEDIADPIEYLKGFSLQTESKSGSTSVVTHFSKNPESFLPPIDTDDSLHPDIKLTKKLFTYFGSDLKCSSIETVHKPKTLSSRPNTSVFKKNVKQQGNINNKLLNSSYSSISNSNHEDVKCEDNFEKQVTLFPIVTSLIPSKDKNFGSKKGFLNTLDGKKR